MSQNNNMSRIWSNRNQSNITDPGVGAARADAAKQARSFISKLKLNVLRQACCF